MGVGLFIVPFFWTEIGKERKDVCSLVFWE